MGASSFEVKVLGIEPIGAGSFLLSFERPRFNFQTGQYLSLGIPGHREQREYSIYSGEDDDHLTVLIKEVPEGLVSKRLTSLRSGDLLHVDGPFGYFTLQSAQKTHAPLLFIATGTGISPFHSFVRSQPQLEYRLVHGIRTSKDLELSRGFDPQRVVTCVSRENAGSYNGRVTDYLKSVSIAPEAHAFLCGNCDMIYQAFDLLRAAGVSSDRIYTEVYF